MGQAGRCLAATLHAARTRDNAKGKGQCQGESKGAGFAGGHGKGRVKQDK
jgi:hypothetical protein